MRNYLFLTLLLLFCFGTSRAQISTTGLDLVPGIEYEIGGIAVSGSGNLDNTVVVLLSGLSVGDKVTFPGEKIQDAIRSLWKQKLFEDVSVVVTGRQGKIVFLEIRLSELPKLSKFAFLGVKKGDKDDLRESLELSRGLIVTENLVVNSQNKIRNFYIDKGYLNAEVNIRQERDTTENNAVILYIDVDRKEKVKIKEINFHGNQALTDRQLRKAMKETKRKSIWNIFKSSKLIKKDYRDDKSKIVELYNEKGYRDMRIVSDSIYKISKNRLAIDIRVEEGRKYYFRNISWLGNTKYSTDVLDQILGIKKGDVFDGRLLQERLFYDPNSNDISSLYLDNGYLFFNLNPVEVRVEGDSIDYEMRIREGRQATIRNVTVTGNDRTNDHVVIRELRTRPGELFRRSDIQRSMRELAQLGYFDPQQLNVNPQPNVETGTVDVEYTVVERSTSQLELQGGWGGGRIVGTLGLNFNNFSARNIFNKKAWRPLPSGDGQTINLRAQSNGLFFQSYSFSFTEPWLGGKKPHSLTFSLYHNVQTNGVPKSDPDRQSLYITGATVGLGRRLKWPDDYFTLYQAVEFQQFSLQDFQTGFLDYDNGISNNLNYKISLGRNNTDVPIFPTQGSNLSLTVELTPPYSLLDGRDYSSLEASEKFRWIEYHKWKFTGSWFASIAKNFVLMTKGEFGFLGDYNEDIGLPPFERFYVGGDGLQNFVIDGREVIGLRGYPNNSLSSNNGDPMYNKFTLEARYLISPNPNAQVFALVFAEGGNSYSNFEEYRPFEMKRSTGFGVRIFMPMFGLLGIDFGYGFDNFQGTVGRSGWQTHFIIGQQF